MVSTLPCDVVPSWVWFLAVILVLVILGLVDTYYQRPKPVPPSPSPPTGILGPWYVPEVNGTYSTVTVGAQGNVTNAVGAPIATITALPGRDYRLSTSLLSPSFGPTVGTLLLDGQHITWNDGTIWYRQNPGLGATLGAPTDLEGNWHVVYPQGQTTDIEVMAGTHGLQAIGSDVTAVTLTSTPNGTYLASEPGMTALGTGTVTSITWSDGTTWYRSAK